MPALSRASRSPQVEELTELPPARSLFSPTVSFTLQQLRAPSFSPTHRAEDRTDTHWRAPGLEASPPSAPTSPMPCKAPEGQAHPMLLDSVARPSVAAQLTGGTGLFPMHGPNASHRPVRDSHLLCGCRSQTRGLPVPTPEPSNSKGPVLPTPPHPVGGPHLLHGSQPLPLQPWGSPHNGLLWYFLNSKRQQI